MLKAKANEKVLGVVSVCLWAVTIAYHQELTIWSSATYHFKKNPLVFMRLTFILKKTFMSHWSSVLLCVAKQACLYFIPVTYKQRFVSRVPFNCTEVFICAVSSLKQEFPVLLEPDAVVIDCCLVFFHIVLDSTLVGKRASKTFIDKDWFMLILNSRKTYLMRYCCFFLNWN